MNEGIEKVLITGYVAVNSHVKIEENDGSNSNKISDYLKFNHGK